MWATWQERQSPSVNYGFCLLHTTSSYMYDHLIYHHISPCICHCWRIEQLEWYSGVDCCRTKAGKSTAPNNVRPKAFWALLRLKVQKLIFRHSMRICIYVCFLFPFCVNISEPGGSPKIVIMIQFAQFISYQLLQRHAKIFIKRQKYS